MKNHNYSVAEYDGTAEDKTNYKKKPTYAAVLLDAILKALFRPFGARHSERGERTKKNHLFEFTIGLSALACAALVLEITVAGLDSRYANQKKPAQSANSISWARSAHLSWLSFRVGYIAHPLQAVVNLCIILSVIQSVDRLLLCLGCFWIKLKNIKPRIDQQHLRFGSNGASEEYEYPSVLVQMPMCNEREVYEQSISAACQFDWPRDRLLIQVLDDSDDEAIEQLVRAEVSKWRQRGVNIIYRHRSLRTGYKAGNLKSAMNCDYVKDYEFVAIFDADFQPNPDFLKQTVPHFKGNPELGLVQTRWEFVNKDENLITRLQNITLCFHFEVEQQVNGVFLDFFGFNGTAGVWRVEALEGSGGWLDRTTVEDMDIAVRAHMNGWKFILLNDVKVLCEAPGSFEFYRKQQYRWHSGPMDLLRFCLPDVIASKISKWKKANLILLFFLLRKLILPFYSFTLLCIILPVTMFVPEAELPVWLIFYLPLLMSFLNVFVSPRSFPFIIPYILFENTMSLTKFSAMLSGLLQLGGSDEWIVTKKAGRTSESKLLAAAEREYKELSDRKVHGAAFDSELDAMNKVKDPEIKEENSNGIYKEELVLAVLLLAAAVRGLLSRQWIHFSVLLFQGVSFLVVGLGLIGKDMGVIKRK